MSAVPSQKVLVTRDFQPDNSIWKLRPTFDVSIAVERDVAVSRLQKEFERDDRGRLFLMHGEYGELHLPRAEHRLWSPHLSFYLTQYDQQSIIHGRFAPRMDVWTFVWVLYLAFAFSAFYGLALAYSQIMLQQTPWGFAVALASLVAIFTLYVVAHVGQHWSADQMAHLRSQLDEILHAAGIAQI